MTRANHTVSCMHGEMTQQELENIINAFRSGTTRVLITTDLFARRIDVAENSLFINNDIPDEKVNYIHRIGRSGRFGRRGLAINFDFSSLKEIENHYSTKIEEMPSNIADTADLL